MRQLKPVNKSDNSEILCFNSDKVRVRKVFSLKTQEIARKLNCETQEYIAKRKNILRNARIYCETQEYIAKRKNIFHFGIWPLPDGGGFCYARFDRYVVKLL